MLVSCRFKISANICKTNDTKDLQKNGVDISLTSIIHERESLMMNE